MTLRVDLHRIAALLGTGVALSFLGQARAADSLQYNRDIRPILSDRCFRCHGPDKGSRKAGLRLDQAADAYAEGREKGTHPIVPHQPDKSLVVQRIFSQDEEEVMPPAKSHLTLSAEEKATLRRWIAEGAKYQQHWAFIPVPDKVPVPAVKNQRWARNEIDRFILARLEKEKLQPASEADKNRWLRRVTYDLTGLPPTPEEVAAFLADQSSEAHAKVVDRLLASPHFGERMAVPWLDAARYADSYGYQSDQLCPTWPYRDWVVGAFNRNLPYDQFLTEQLAGDLLPKATRQQRLATAFNRLHRQTNEGGSIAEEWRNEYVSDRVATFSTTFLALTFECARCHDHKYDPILQRDYYSLSAFFNSIDEYGLYLWGAPNHVPTPALMLPTPEQEQAMSATTAALESATNRLHEITTAAEAGFQDWLKCTNLTAEIPGLVAQYSMDEPVNGNQFTNSVNPTNVSSALRGNTRAAGKSGQAIQFTGDDDITFPNPAGSLQPWEQYSVVFWLRLPPGLTNAILFHRSDGTDTGFWGTELCVEDGRLFFADKRFWPGNAMAVQSLAAVPTDQWVQVGVSYDGSGRAEGMRLFLNGEAAKSEILRDQLTKSPQSGGGGLTFGARMRCNGLKGGLVDELQIYGRALAPVELRQLFSGHALQDALTQKDVETLRPYYLAAFAADVAEARKARGTAVRKYLEARDPVQETSVMEELPAPTPAYLLARGRYDAPKTEAARVQRTLPAALPTLPAGAPANRLGLAEWLTDPRHPLTARVAVNRFWQMIFGRGIVATTENLGSQGAQPTHPELLDWLARDFIASGWDVKATLKKIVLSATYRQDSKPSPGLLEKDPENLLLARGSSQRLPAEMIRDTALAASGLLKDEQGGPPVSPYLPGDLWRESNTMSPAYQQSKGDNLYRRSLYTVWKRTAPMPDMVAFDAPSREVCVVKRSTTGTPQQAFVLLNDTQFVEAARVLAEKVLREGGATPEGRIRLAFRRLTAREPDAREIKLLEELLREQTAIFQKEPERAEKLLAVGDRKRDAALNPLELAATTMMTQAILNLDATIWKR